MLVLSRKTGQRIVIGNGIEVEVISIRPGQVRLGITCPRDIPVVRTELIRTQSQEDTDEPVEQPQILVPR